MAEFRDTYRDFILPLLAVAETIGTKGASPGTSAMNQQRIMYDSEDRKKAQVEKEKQEAEKARKAAMEEKLYGYKVSEYEDKKSATQQAQEKAAKRAAILMGIPDEQERVRLSKEFSMEDDPSNYYKTVKDNSDKDEEKKFNKSTQLRKEFTANTKTFVEVQDSYGRILASGKNPTAAGDLALIFNYMKMLDPGSTVREGEFANAENSGGIPDRIRAKYNKAINGERLSEAQRSDFLSRSTELYGAQKKQYDKQKEYYTTFAGRHGLDLEDVIMNLEQQFDTVGTHKALKGVENAGKKLPAAKTGSASKYSPDIIAAAKQALSDPEATPEERAKAQEILRGL